MTTMTVQEKIDKIMADKSRPWEWRQQLIFRISAGQVLAESEKAYLDEVCVPDAIERKRAFDGMVKTVDYNDPRQLFKFSQLAVAGWCRMVGISADTWRSYSSGRSPIPPRKLLKMQQTALAARAMIEDVKI